jgi:hypothetical protein
MTTTLTADVDATLRCEDRAPRTSPPVTATVGDVPESWLPDSRRFKNESPPCSYCQPSSAFPSQGGILEVP